jgi:hypothetical protein
LILAKYWRFECILGYIAMRITRRSIIATWGMIGITLQHFAFGVDGDTFYPVILIA